ncbi:MAG: hypothetical protein KAV87_48625, partial [Desulfobacteraceae bacterium]|nr:hypothetical protein [Desulfobacteraceae bacterium]
EMGRQKYLPCARRAPLEVKSCRLLTGRGFLTAWRESEAIQRGKCAGLQNSIKTGTFNGNLEENPNRKHHCLT